MSFLKVICKLIVALIYYKLIYKNIKKTNTREHAMIRATSIAANKYVFLKRAIIVFIQSNMIILKNK